MSFLRALRARTLAQLLRCVDVDGPFRACVNHGLQRVGRDRAQRMGHNADGRIWQSANRRARAFEEPEKAVGRIEKAPLRLSRRRTAEPTISIKGRQECEADSGRRRRRNPRAHFGSRKGRPSRS